MSQRSYSYRGAVLLTVHIHRTPTVYDLAAPLSCHVHLFFGAPHLTPRQLIQLPVTDVFQRISIPCSRDMTVSLRLYTLGQEDGCISYQYDALIGDGRAGVEAPSCERGVHVRTCRCTPHLTCVSLLSNGSLAAHQVQTRSAQQFARCGKRVCTCARADATHPDLCKARIYWAPSHTKFERNPPSRLRDLEKGCTLCTCARADALHLRHVESTYLMGP